MKETNLKPIEIFCGTGGVGKTTLATSRAIYLAEQGHRILLITIDPAKRLKEVLNLNSDNAGLVEDCNHFLSNENPGHLDALLMSPSATIKRIASRNQTAESFAQDYIVKILSRPHGGLNEILSVVELQYHLNSKKYDSIILDTPPGSHFIDFLNGCKKINSFFDNSFIEVFKYLREKLLKDATIELDEKKNPFFKRLIGTGVNKLLSYLGKVTGSSFINDFIQSISSIYENKNSFIEALSLETELKKESFSNWYLVTSCDHDKILEMEFLSNEASFFLHRDSFLLINYSSRENLKKWDTSKASPEIKLLAESLRCREQKIMESAKRNFEKVFTFPEVLDSSPQKHVLELKNYWK